MRYSKLRSFNLKLFFVLLAFVVLATIYSLVTPIGEGPDEPGHAHYVFFLAQKGRLPVQSTERQKSEVPGEGHQPPLAYALLAPLVNWLPVEQRQFDLPANARFTWAGGNELNAVAHGSHEYLPWQGFVLAWHVARMGGIAVGAAAVLCTYLAAQAWLTRSGKSRPSNIRSTLPLIAAALVAFNPQFLFVSALITNDALLITLSALLLWLSLRDWPRYDWRWLIAHPALLGFVLGLALLTKQSALLLAPIALAAVLEQSWRTRSLAKPKAPGWAQHLLAVLVFTGVTLIVCGWWYVRNARLYGDLFGMAVFQAEFTTQAFIASSLAAWMRAFAQLHASFWARFGWMNVPAPDWMIWFFMLVEILALTGLIGAIVQRRHSTHTTVKRLLYTNWPLLALPILAFAWVVSFAFTTGLVAWQGRLVFPALPAVGILLAIGLSRLPQLFTVARSVQMARATTRVAVLMCAALALWSPFVIIQPAYPFHTLSEATALERLGTPVYGRFSTAGELGAELRSWQIIGTTKPGDTPQITLMWHSRSRQDRSWTVFIHLVDDQKQILAKDDMQPQNGTFPMKQWVAGDWIEDQHILTLPRDLAPGTYHVRVGLFDARTQRRAGVYNQRNKLQGDAVELGTIVIGN